MRFVSVVVPLWLIATTSVSDMSAASPKPESSVASTASTDDRVRRAERALQRGDEALAGDRGGALADHEHPAELPGASRARRSSDSVSCGSSTTGTPSRSTSLPRSVLRNEAGASEISLSR